MLRQQACCQSKHTFVCRLQLRVTRTVKHLSSSSYTHQLGEPTSDWRQLLINCSSSQFVATEFSKMICFVQSFPLSFPRLGWNCLSQDTVLSKTATQLRPPLGCGLKSVLTTKAGEETSATDAPLGPKKHYSGGISAACCLSNACKSADPAPVPVLPCFRAGAETQVRCHPA